MKNIIKCLKIKPSPNVAMITEATFGLKKSEEHIYAER